MGCWKKKEWEEKRQRKEDIMKLRKRLISALFYKQ
jgi:hypothetical protein